LDRFDGARIYLSPCGHGLGHAGRIHPIAEELRRRGADVLFSTYLEGVDYIRKQGFPVVRSPHLSMVTLNGRIDLKMTSVTQGLPAMPRFLRQTNAEIAYMKEFKPDVVVSDSRLSSVYAANLLRVPTALVMNQFQPIVPRTRHNFKLSKIADGVLLTLIGRGWASSDVILIPDFPEPYTICLESMRVPRPYQHLVRFVGSILPVKPEDIGGDVRIREELGVKAGDRLIFAAVSGPQQERLPLISTLKPIFEEFPEDYRIVMSMGMPNGGSDPLASGRLTTIPWVDNRFELLKACDLVISRAGHETIMQSICFGKPQILIPTPGHTEQYANARRVKELGVGEAIHQRDLSRERLLSLVKTFFSENEYGGRLLEINSNIKSKDGVMNSVEEIDSLMRRRAH